MVKVVVRYLCVVIISFFMMSIIMTSSLTLCLLIKNYFIDELIQFLDMVSATIMIILPVRYFPFWFSGACMILNYIEKAVGIDVKDSSSVIFKSRGAKCSNMMVACNYPILLGFIYFNMFYRHLVSYEILPSIKIKCKYFELPDANGNMFYYLGSSLLHPENDSESQGTFFPTIMFFVAPDFCKQYDKKMKIREVIGSNYCTIPIFNYSSAKDNFLQKQVETNILFFNPYIIIIETGLEKIMKQTYTFTADHKIEICGQCFPYFLFSEMEQHSDEILEYSNKEYRGIKIPIKLTEDEIESLEYDD